MKLSCVFFLSEVDFQALVFLLGVKFQFWEVEAMMVFEGLSRSWLGG